MNDERPIEKLLRRAAKKRSADAGTPPELHPANRRSLQAEVARQFPKPGAAKQSALGEFWAGLTLRWAYAVGLFVVLAVAALVLLPTASKSKGKTNLAQSAPREDRREMELVKNTAAAPAALAAPAVVADSAVQVEREISSRRDIKDASTTLGETAVASGAIQPSGQKAFASIGTIAVAKSTLTPTSPPAAISGDKPQIARDGGQERERAILNSQAYANVGAAQSPALKKEARFFKESVPVLANFKIEQAGRDLRVVDGDGSVYNGVVDEENTLYKQVVERQNQILSNSYENKFKFQSPKLADAQAAPKQQEANYYLYRVEGTNRSLNQNVIFTWNFIDTNALAAGNLNYNNAAQKLDATKLPSQFPALLQNSFINGRAQFSEGREIEVNAVPVKP